MSTASKVTFAASLLFTGSCIAGVYYMKEIQFNVITSAYIDIRGFERLTAKQQARRIGIERDDERRKQLRENAVDHEQQAILHQKLLKEQAVHRTAYGGMQAACNFAGTGQDGVEAGKRTPSSMLAIYQKRTLSFVKDGRCFHLMCTVIPAVNTPDFTMHNDILRLIVDQLDPAVPADIRALHTCLLVSRSSFQLAAAKLWSDHGLYHTARGLTPRTQLAEGGSSFKSINKTLVGLCKQGGDGDDRADNWRAWRCRVYVRSVTVIDVHNHEHGKGDIMLDPSVVAPLFGRIACVIINTMPYAKKPPESESAWLDWIKTRMASPLEHGPSEVVYHAPVLEDVAGFVRFPCVKTLTVTCRVEHVAQVTSMVLNQAETGLRALRFETWDEDWYDGIDDSWNDDDLNEWKDVRVKQPAMLRQLKLANYEPVRQPTVLKGFLAQFELLTHVDLFLKGFCASQVSELERCAGTLTHLTLRSAYCEYEEGDQLYHQVFTTIGRLTNLTHLSVHLDADLPPGAPKSVFMDSLAKLVKLTCLTILGSEWAGEGLTAALDGMRDLRELALCFSKDEDDFEFDLDESSAVPVDLEISARRLRMLEVVGAQRLVVMDLDELLRDGWDRLETFRVVGCLVGPRGYEGAAEDKMKFKELLLDTRRTPRLKYAVYGDDSEAMEEAVFERDGSRRFDYVIDLVCRG
ncbi:hypothetical protein HK101_000596 [Irineochytrium annulatum]|nr:hypothetical protein HK101_000596 [Irineochytrium annulatum]